MDNAELFLLLFGSLAVTAFARWRGWPAPLLVTGVALAVSFVPGIPRIDIDGELILTLVLPPLLYSAALDVSFLNFRRALPQIRSLGFGLVFATAGAVGLVAYWLMPSLTLPGALLLGAIVSPPDAVSAAAIGRRLGLPRRVMTVMSGESLINDASSLTLFRVFLAIAAGATVTWGQGVVEFLLAVGVGAGLGLVLGIVVNAIRTRLDDPVVLGTLGLLMPFAAYAVAERMGGSGVLAVVAMGLLIGFHAPRTSYTTRQQERPVWLSIDLLLEGFVFALIGLQLQHVVADVAASPLGLGHSLALAGAVFAVVVLIRPAWVFGTDALTRGVRRLMPGRHGALDAHPEPHRLNRRELTVLSWAGMRGVVTLATAAAIPFGTEGGLPAADRHTIFIVAFVVTVGTLLSQGLTMPWLIRTLGVGAKGEDAQDAREVSAVRALSARAGRAYLDEQRASWNERFGAETTSRVFDHFAHKLGRVEAATTELADSAPTREHYTELAKGWLAVRRDVIVRERDAGHLNEEVMRELVLGLDAEELALDTVTGQRARAD